MKTIKAIIPALLIVGAFLFFISNFIHDLKSVKKIAGFEEKDEVLSKAAIEKPFVIIITSYNNADSCIKNLLSIFEQKYSNYRVMYIDDCSSDGTYELAKKFIQDLKKDEKIALFRNEGSLSRIENIYRAVHECKDEEIVVLVNGSDWLAHDRVLETLNNCYANPNTWMTYGNYCAYPSYKKGPRNDIPRKIHANHSYREFVKNNFVFPPLRTAYAGLFKKIKMEDLLQDGSFIKDPSDHPFILPLIEMAKGHAHYMKSVLYIANQPGAIESQSESITYLSSLLPYQPISDWRSEEKTVLGCDLVIYSHDRPLQLYAFLESIKKNVKGLGRLTVFYQSKNEHFTRAYEEVKAAFPSYEFVKTSQNFKDQLLTTITAFPAHFIMFALEDEIVKEPLDLAKCAAELQKKGAYGFFLNKGGNVVHSVYLDNPVYAWQFIKDSAPLEMGLYSKEMVLSQLRPLQFSDFDTLKNPWASSVDSKKIGLCYETAKILTISINQDLDLLLTKFHEGLKIDLDSIFQVGNAAIDVEREPTYVKR